MAQVTTTLTPAALGTLHFCIYRMNKPSYKHLTVFKNTCTKEKL